MQRTRLGGVNEAHDLVEVPVLDAGGSHPDLQPAVVAEDVVECAGRGNLKKQYMPVVCASQRQLLCEGLEVGLGEIAVAVLEPEQSYRRGLIDAVLVSGLDRRQQGLKPLDAVEDDFVDRQACRSEGVLGNEFDLPRRRDGRCGRVARAGPQAARPRERGRP